MSYRLGIYNSMTWNWQQKDWPNFTYDIGKLTKLEDELLYESGILLGTFKHLSEENKEQIRIDLLSEEALKTSEIEGEYLQRDSVQSSIRQQFGLDIKDHKVPPAELGIAEMTVDLYKTFAEQLSDKKLFNWHEMIMKGRRDLENIGGYRTHKEPMQVVSGYIHDPTIHFEAPPSNKLNNEMNAFIGWFNNSSPTSGMRLPTMIRSGIAHLYFVSIHPFEDGNGRIARALSEKALSQGIWHPTLIALSYMIEKNRKTYYAELESANKSNEITQWLLYFGTTVLQAQRYTLTKIEFLIEKAKFYDQVGNQLNERQAKVIARMFREGPEGFKGGLSAEKYISITKTSRATATRDLHDLVTKGALTKHGELKHSRYYLNVKTLVNVNPPPI